jgi:hypothetical protein
LKRFLFGLAFLLASMSFVAAQGNGGGNGSGNSYAWGNQQSLINWLENGGSIPRPLAMRVINEAREWGMANFGLTQGQMVQKYNQGLLTIEYLYTAPPMLRFRVRLDGGLIDITITDDF